MQRTNVEFAPQLNNRLTLGETTPDISNNNDLTRPTFKSSPAAELNPALLMRAHHCQHVSYSVMMIIFCQNTFETFAHFQWPVRCLTASLAAARKPAAVSWATTKINNMRGMWRMTVTAALLQVYTERCAHCLNTCDGPGDGFDRLACCECFQGSLVLWFLVRRFRSSACRVLCVTSLL